MKITHFLTVSQCPLVCSLSWLFCQYAIWQWQLGKELWLKSLLENIESQEPEKIANIIIQEAIDNGLGIAKDDMTIIVAKLENKWGI